MRVLFDLRVVEPRWHGIARYGVELLAALARVAPDIEWITFLRPGVLLDGFPEPRVRVVRLDVKPYSLAEQVVLPIAIARVRPDLYVSPTYIAPFACPVPLVFTVHDLIDFQSPASKLRHRLYFPYLLPLLTRRARFVMTVSEHSRRELVRFGLATARVRTVPNGNSLAPATGVARHRRLLHITNGRPHKNTPFVFEIFGRLARRFDGLSLMIVGLDRLPDGATPDARVELRRAIEPSDLAATYTSAAVTLVPSLCEGFGLPALESMACGTPVVVSNRAALPEVVGDAAPVADPNDAGAWVAIIARILGDPTYARTLSERALARAATMTWEASARAFLAAISR